MYARAYFVGQTVRNNNFFFGSYFYYSSFEMSCPSSLENKQHKSFSSKLSSQHMFANGFKPRNLQKTKGILWLFSYWSRLTSETLVLAVPHWLYLWGWSAVCPTNYKFIFCFCFFFFLGINMKLMDNRPSSLAKFFSSGSGQELGNTSSSEGEKDSPPPEWDSVPIHKAGSCKYSGH